ncbi:MAG: needle chaperone SctE [Chlamydiae bacterium]|nr:needle chaperone SctE [Chlamydiota bacterium]
MFGLKKETKKKGLFDFDLEKDLEDPKKGEELVHKVDHRIQEIKDKLRSGANSEEFNDLGVLLHGYSSLHKVLIKTNKNKS